MLSPKRTKRFLPSTEGKRLREPPTRSGRYALNYCGVCLRVIVVVSVMVPETDEVSVWL